MNRLILIGIVIYIFTNISNYIISHTETVQSILGYVNSIALIICIIGVTQINS